MRNALLPALILSAILIGITRGSAEERKFFENGQPTRTGADAAMFSDTPTRFKIDLNGPWNYTVDGKEWGAVSVPSAYDFTARVTFQRKFNITPGMLDTCAFSLVGYGINYQSEITINGNFIGRHMGGYSSFVFPIPPGVLQVGEENAIKVSDDNELTPRTTLPLRQQIGGWRSYGGIFRDLYILATPKLAIERTTVTSELGAEGKGARFIVHAEIADHGSGIKPEQGSTIGFQVLVFDKLSGDMVGRSGIAPVAPLTNQTVPVTSEVALSAPKLWSPDSPDLYVIQCQIVRLVGKEVSLLDQYECDAGVRDLRWKDGRLYLNNVPQMLKGILWQEDHATYGSAMTYEALEKDIASIKSVGANLIRCLYPPHPYILNLCDRYGIFLMEEIPLDNVPEVILSKDYYQDLATTYAREMVERDQNHVCVVAWGIGDDFETTSPNACDYVNGLRNTIKALDRRSVYFSTHAIHDSCFDNVDLIALSTSRTDPKGFREALRQCRTSYPEKPIIVARYGRDVEPGNHNGYSDPLSLESQARGVMSFFEVIKEAKIAGGVLWSFSDWRTDRAALTAHGKDPFLQTMGIVSYDRVKRTAFDVTRALYNGEKVQALPIGNYSSGSPIIYVMAGFIALVSLAFVYNSNRRFRDCVHRSLFRTYNFFADVRDQRVITYTLSAFLAAVIAVTLATVLSSVFSHYRGNLLLDNLLSQVMTDGVKESFIALVWSPPRFILIVSGVIFLAMGLVALLIRILSVSVRTRVYFYHTFSITVWSMLPYIILIPIAMIMFRLMEADFYVLPVLGLIALVSLWVLGRLLKGISIIYDVFSIKVYAVSLLMIIVAGAAAYGYFDYTRAMTTYLKYMIQSLSNSA